MVISSQAIRFGQDGWLEDARRVPSPNHDHRPEALAVDLLVIHYISLPAGHFAGDAIERLFTNRMDPQAHPSFQGLADLKVSAHFLIRRHVQRFFYWHRARRQCSPTLHDVTVSSPCATDPCTRQAMAAALRGRAQRHCARP